MPNVSELAREDEARALKRGTSCICKGGYDDQCYQHGLPSHDRAFHADKQAPQKPYVGMLATYVIGSDQYAGILIEVSKTGHQVTWQRVDGAGLVRSHIHRCSRRSNGEYIQVGSKYGHLELGVAKTVLDEGF
jgi:hypothetical protein